PDALLPEHGHLHDAAMLFRSSSQFGVCGAVGDHERGEVVVWLGLTGGREVDAWLCDLQRRGECERGEAVEKRGQDDCVRLSGHVSIPRCQKNRLSQTTKPIPC